MGKKFVTISVGAKNYKLYTGDIRMVYKKIVKKIPPLPRFYESPKSYYD